MEKASLMKQIDFLATRRREIVAELENSKLSEEQRSKLVDERNFVTKAINELYEKLEKYISGDSWTPETKNENLNFKNYDVYTDSLFEASGLGGYKNQLQNVTRDIDRYQSNILPTNREHVGYTFITRPKLNFTSTSLRQCRELTPLDTMNPNSMAFMIRCLLDTKFCRMYHSEAEKSELFNINNPFLQILCNRLTGITGFPDVIIQSQTTEGGFHSEDLTFAIGTDGLRKTYDLTLYFKDIQEGPIAAIFEYWCKFIEHVTRGTMIPYSEDIDARRLCYTVSIYRFIVDPSRSKITRYAKATGCFPKSFPIGAMMNANDNEIALTEIGKYSVPFVANHVGYNDYAILVEFNALMRRYCNGIEEHRNLPNTPEYNFSGLPYIETDKNGIHMVFKDVPYKKVSPPDAALRKQALIENALTSVISLDRRAAQNWLASRIPKGPHSNSSLPAKLDKASADEVMRLYDKFHTILT